METHRSTPRHLPATRMRQLSQKLRIRFNLNETDSNQGVGRPRHFAAVARIGTHHLNTQRLAHPPFRRDALLGVQNSHARVLSLEFRRLSRRALVWWVGAANSMRQTADFTMTHL